MSSPHHSSENSALLPNKRSPGSGHARQYRIETHSPGSRPLVKTFTCDTTSCSDHETGLLLPPPQRSAVATALNSYVPDLAFCDEDTLQAIVNEREAVTVETQGEVTFIINLSLWANVLLFSGKFAAYYISGSMSVAASLIDSFLDLLVQLIIYLSNEGMTSVSAQDKVDYPAGKSRFEPVGLIACAALMCIAALELIGRSVGGLYDGFIGGNIPEVPIDFITIGIILFVITSKTALWMYCLYRGSLSSTVETLAFDHRNDVLSNAAAAIAIVLVRASPSLWWSDAVGCIVISVYIAVNWYGIAMEKVHELVGRSADAEFTQRLTEFVETYHPQLLTLDVMRAYHFGSRFLVEIEIILPPTLTVREAHDISLALQQAVERMDLVERAFVHVDYTRRLIDEHDVAAVAKEKLAAIRSAREANAAAAAIAAEQRADAEEARTGANAAAGPATQAAAAPGADVNAAQAFAMAFV